MEQITLTKSLYIALGDDGTPGDVQLQYVQRWTGLPEDVTLPDTYLPLERFTLADATPAQRASVKAVMGAAGQKAATGLAELKREHEALKEAHATELAQLQEKHAAQLQEAHARPDWPQFKAALMEWIQSADRDHDLGQGRCRDDFEAFVLASVWPDVSSRDLALT